MTIGKSVVLPILYLCTCPAPNPTTPCSQSDCERRPHVWRSMIPAAITLIQPSRNQLSADFTRCLIYMKSHFGPHTENPRCNPPDTSARPPSRAFSGREWLRGVGEAGVKLL